MAQSVRLVALVALTIAPTTVGAVGHAAEPSTWTASRVRFEPLQVNESRTEIAGLGAYRGTVEVQAGGGLSIYNQLPLEDYVKGIVEMPPEWPVAALQAQAIAARTYGLHIQSARDEICPDDNCQFYMGLFGMEREGGERWAAAVDATAGQALLGNGEPIRAEFSASNGGRSLPGGASYLRPVDDPDDAHSPTHHWQYSLPLSAFAPFVEVPDGFRLVALSRDGDTIEALLRAEHTEPAPQARAPQPGLPAAHAPAVAQPEQVRKRSGVAEFVSAVNAGMDAPGGLPLPFPSTTFSLGTEGDQAVVDGGGWGHGRGMSQWGAYGKALRGYSASQILATYYGGLRPSALTDEQASSDIRVALGGGRRSVDLVLTHPSRVVTDEGTVVVPLTLGRWRVVPARGGLRVVAPEEAGDELAVAGARLAPGRRVAGAQPTVRFSVSGPAVVRVRLDGPGVEGGPDPLVMLDAGEQTVPLPSTRYPGEHVVTIEADGGPGRRAVAHVRFAVRGHAVLQASIERPPELKPAWAAAAGALVFAALAGAIAVRHRRTTT